MLQSLVLEPMTPQPTPKPESLQTVFDAESSYARWSQAETTRENLLRTAKVSNGSIDPKPYEQPTEMDKKAILGEKIGQLKTEVKDACRSAFMQKGNPTKMNKVLSQVLTEKSYKNPTPETVAQVQVLARESISERRNWNNVAKLIELYPQLAFDDDFVATTKQSIINQGQVNISDLMSTDEKRNAEKVLRLLTKPDSPVAKDDELRIKTHEIDGYKLKAVITNLENLKLSRRQEVTLTQEEWKLLLPKDIIKTMPDFFSKIQSVKSTNQIHGLASESFGQILAHLSRDPSLNSREDLREQLKYMALGYTEVLLDSRPVNPDFQSLEERQYNKLSTAAAKNIATVAGNDVIVYELARLDTALGEEVKRIVAKSNSRDFDAYLQSQGQEIAKKRGQ